ncbi:MAG: single-stranded DNA-binding protein [Candidatus Nanopelagicales bacterium]|nr:single-stranded DNA-binding protein [Candidatus Nanopelagicales bacterium]
MGILGNRMRQKELPSGDIATIFAVVVERSARDQAGKIKFDTVTWQTFCASVAQRVLRLEPGAQVICAGVLRRRFWKTAGGLGSALEGEVRSLKRAPENR